MVNDLEAAVQKISGETRKKENLNQMGGPASGPTNEKNKNRAKLGRQVLREVGNIVKGKKK